MNTTHFESFEKGLEFLVFFIAPSYVHEIMATWYFMPAGKKEGVTKEVAVSIICHHCSEDRHHRCSQSVIACKNIRATVIVPL